MRLELSGANMLMFRNASHFGLNVVQLRDDGSIGGFAGVDVQHTDSFNGFYNTGYRFNHGGITPFGNVGHTFD